MTKELTGKPQISIPIKNIENFKEYYKKHRIVLKSFISPIGNIQNKEAMTKCFHTDLDIYTLAMEGKNMKEEKYFLLENNLIVGQINTKFQIITEIKDFKEEERKIQHEIPQEKYESNHEDLFLDSIQDCELKRAIKRSIDSRNEIESGLQDQVKSLDNPIFK